MSVRILNADCLTALPQLAAEGFRAHAVVTDPPYHLTSIVKRFGSESAAPVKPGKTGAYARSSAGFMGQQWDGGRVAFKPETWAAIAECMLPGAHLAAFGGTRTFHRMAVAIEDAGFEIRDTLCWLYGSGFPKSHNVERAVAMETCPLPGRHFGSTLPAPGKRLPGDHVCPVTPGSEPWLGHGSALKPAFEPIILARKPLDGTVAANTLKHGCGGLNIDAARIPIGGDGSHHIVATSQGDARSSYVDSTVCTCSEHEASQCDHSRDTHNRVSASSGRGERASRPASERTHDRLGLEPQGSPGDCLPYRHFDDAHARAEEEVDQEPPPQLRGGDRSPDHCAKCGRSRATSMPYGTIPNIQPQGRWPANVVLSDDPEVEEAFARFGERKSYCADQETASRASGKRFDAESNAGRDVYGKFATGFERGTMYADTGTASRFYFTAKADAADRAGSRHPTVKPTSLCRWLVALVCPPGGTVLDPFAGTGSTGLAADQLGMNAVLIERDAQYAADARRKIASDAPLLTEVA